MADDGVAVDELLEAARASAAAWSLDGEVRLRAAVLAACEKGSSTQRARAWIALGYYLWERGRRKPAALAFALARDQAQSAGEHGLVETTLVGLFHSLSELGDEPAALAARALLGQLPDSVRAQLTWRMRRRLRQPDSVIDAAIASLSDDLPDFETRFLAGDLRFDRVEDVVDLFAERPQHYRQSLWQTAQDLERRAYRRQFYGRLIWPGLLLVAFAAVCAVNWRSVGRWPVLPVAVSLAAIYSVLWIKRARTAWHWVKAHESGRWLEQSVEQSFEEHPSHGTAVAILERFAKARVPFVLYLRSFEGEAAQTLAPKGVTLIGSSKEEFAREARLAGSSADGYIEANQWVIGTQTDASRFEKYLGRHLAGVIPVVTIANPASRLGRGIVPRFEVANDVWARAVRLLISAAHFVVIEPARASAGVCQELELIKLADRHGDTIVVLPSEKSRSEQEQMRQIARIGFDQAAIPATPFTGAFDDALFGFARIVDDELFGDHEPSALAVFRDVLPDERTPPDRYGAQRAERAALRSEGISFHREGVAALERGELTRASELLEKAAEIFARIKDRAHLAMPLTYQGRVWQAREDLQQAEKCFAAAVEIQAHTGPPNDYIGSLHHLALVLFEDRAYERARDTFADMRSTARRWNFTRGEARAMEGLAMCACAAGDRAVAAEQLREALKLPMERQDKASITGTLEAIMRGGQGAAAPIVH